MLSEKNHILALNNDSCFVYSGRHANNVYLLRATLAVLTVHAADFRDIPSSIPTTTDSWDVPLNKACPALVPHQRVDLISLTLLTKGMCILHQRGLATGH